MVHSHSKIHSYRCSYLRNFQRFLQSKTLLDKTVTRVEEKEGVNMCKALDDLYNDGFEQGEDRKLMEQVQKKLQKGCTIPEIAEMLEESEEAIEKVVNRLS